MKRTDNLKRLKPYCDNPSDAYQQYNLYRQQQQNNTRQHTDFTDEFPSENILLIR